MKRIIAMVLTIAMVLCSMAAITTVSAEKIIFDDVTEDFAWASEHIYSLAEQGIINGKGDNKFEPDSPIVREEFAKIMDLGFEVSKENIKKEFIDVVKGSWYEEHVANVVAKKLMKGDSDDTFGVEKSILRQDIALTIARLKYSDEELATYEKYLPADKDADKIDGYAKGAMGYCVKEKIIGGDEAGNLNPTETATRAEIAKMVNVYMENNRETVETGETNETSETEETTETPEFVKDDVPVSELTITGEQAKISLFNDTHFRYTKWFSGDEKILKKMIDDTVVRDDPDLLVFNGDFINIIDSDGNGVAKEDDRIYEIIDYIDSLGVKWTFDFGVSDNECNINRKLILKRAAVAKNCLMTPIGDKELRGETNHIIEIKGADGEIKNALIFFDTVRTGIDEKQKDFLENRLKYYKPLTGAKVYLFAHRAIPQANNMQYGQPIYGKGDSQRMKAEEAGVFDVLVNYKDNFGGAFFGFDHRNAFYGTKDGVFMCFGKASNAFMLDEAKDNSNENGFTRLVLKNNGEKEIQYIKYTYTTQTYEEVEAKKNSFLTETPADLRYNSNGKFKLLQLTDTHVTNQTSPTYVTPTVELPNRDAALYVVQQSILAEKPDFVIFTGDQVFKYYGNKIDNIETYKALGNLMDELNVRWTVAFGNHDANDLENIYSWSDLYESLKEFKTFCGYNADLDENNILIAQTGTGNTHYSIKNSDNKPEWTIFSVDNSWIDYSESYKTWYKAVADKLVAENPEAKALAFAHRPFINFGAQADYEKRMINGRLADGFWLDGDDFGLSKMMGEGIVKGFFCGHFHKDDSIATYKNSKNETIYTGFGKTGDFIAYNTGKPDASGSPMERGCRIFEFTEGDTSKFFTYIREIQGNIIYETTCE